MTWLRDKAAVWWAHVFACGYMIEEDRPDPLAWPADGFTAWCARRVEPVLYYLSGRGR